MRTFASEARRLAQAYTTGDLVPDVIAQALRWWLVRQTHRRRAWDRWAWRSRVFRGGRYGPAPPEPPALTYRGLDRCDVCGPL